MDTCANEDCNDESLDPSILLDGAPIRKFSEYCYSCAEERWEKNLQPDVGDVLVGDGNSLLKGVHDGEKYHVVKEWEKNGKSVLTLQPDDGRRSELNFKRETIFSKLLAADGRGMVYADE